MGNKKRIADNQSIAEVLQVMQGAERLYRSDPLVRRFLPGLKESIDKIPALRERAEDVLLAPDRFNELFTPAGWIAYESMNSQVMKEAIEICTAQGLEVAETYLANSYDGDTLRFGIRPFKYHPVFQKRLRLVELARDDYLEKRYHACIPLLLSLLDGLVNDVSKHVGFFAANADLTVWDCIAAHESGLQALGALMTVGRKKTNDQPIFIPYRHGILHGRELAFDNHIVAAKTWAALFAASDWATAIAEGKKDPTPAQEPTIKELQAALQKNQKTQKLIDDWVPRRVPDLVHLPYEGPSNSLPENSPERAVAEFMENWLHGRFGLMADALLDFTAKPKGKKAGLAKQDFGRRIPKSFIIIGIADRTPAVSQVTIRTVFEGKHGDVEADLDIRTTYQDEKSNAQCRLNCEFRKLWALASFW